MKRGTCIVTIVAVSLFLFTAGSYSAEKPTYGGKLTVGQDVDAVGLDLYKTTAFSTANYVEHAYNALLQTDDKGNVQPCLATSWENPDLKTYTLHLRKGVKFHDGKELGAEDVKATFDRLLDPATGAVRRSNFVQIDRVEIVDQYTVRFILKEPFAPFIRLLAAERYTPILSKDIIEKSDPAKVVVGTGAFQVVEYRPNDKMILKKNSNYWEKGLPYLDELEIRLIKDASSRVAALRAKSVDYTWIVEPQLVQVLQKEKGISSGISPATGKMQVYINCSKPPLDNVKVRQALSSATDRNEIIRVSLMGQAVLTGVIPAVGGEFAYPPEKLPFYDYNPERAKKLLAEAGYPNGLQLKVKVSSSHFIDQYVVQLLQQQWKKVGVDLEIIQEEWGTLLKDANTLNHQMLGLTRTWEPDPDQYIRFDFDIKQRSGFSSPDVEKLVDEGVATSDPIKRVAIYHESGKKLAEYSPILYLYARAQRFEFWRDYVKGYTPTTQTSRINFKQAWIEK